MLDARFGAFVGVSILLALTPGPDFALVTRNALAWGRRGTLFTCAGLACALSIWVAATAAGLAPLLERSAVAAAGVRFAGALYLVWLGTRTWWATRHLPPPLPETLPQHRLPSPAAIWRQGFFSALLNPKLGVFFVTFLPQFVTPGRPALPQLLVLGAVFTAIGIGWMTAYGLSVSRLRTIIGSVRVRRWLERTTGTALVGFGIGLALDRS